MEGAGENSNTKMAASVVDRKRLELQSPEVLLDTGDLRPAKDDLSRNITRTLVVVVFFSTMIRTASAPNTLATATVTLPLFQLLYSAVTSSLVEMPRKKPSL